MKTLLDVSLYDLMAQDLDVWVSSNKQFGFDLEIDGDDGEELVREKSLHPYAAHSFADFCRSYLHAYDLAIKKEVA